MRSWDQLTFEEQDALQRELQLDVERGDLGAVAARTVGGTIDINWINPETGLPLLHYAVGRNQVEIVRLLLDRGAKVTPDQHGRWPSILALELECDDAILDMIENKEAELTAGQTEERQDPQLASTTEGWLTQSMVISTSKAAYAGGFLRFVKFLSTELRERNLNVQISVPEEGVLTISAKNEKDLQSAAVLLDIFVGIEEELRRIAAPETGEDSLSPDSSNRAMNYYLEAVKRQRTIRNKS